jgi:hypothetical protein
MEKCSKQYQTMLHLVRLAIYVTFISSSFICCCAAVL